MKLNITKLKETGTAVIFLSPFLILFLAFLGYPIIYSLMLSFKKVVPTTDLYNIFADMKFCGFDNYIRLLKDTEFRNSLFVTGYYAILNIPLSIFVSLVLAVLLSNKLKGHKLFRSAFFLPNVLDMLVVGIIWVLLYAPQFGVITKVLDTIGIVLSSKGILGDPKTAMLGVVIALVLKNAGYGMILFLAAIQNIPSSVYEAADIDGADAYKKFVHITVPLVKPIIMFMVITGTIGALNAFAEIYAMTGGGPTSQFLGKTFQSTQVSGYYLFKQWEKMDYGYAASISYVILFITIFVSLIYAKVLKQKY